MRYGSNSTANACCCWYRVYLMASSESTFWLQWRKVVVFIVEIVRIPLGFHKTQEIVLSRLEETNERSDSRVKVGCEPTQTPSWPRISALNVGADSSATNSRSALLV